MLSILRPSLLKRQILFILVALIATLSFFAFWSLHALQESTQEILRERLEIAEMVALHIDMHLSEDAVRVQTIAAKLTNLDTSDTEREKAALREAYYLRADAFPYGLFLVDRFGRILWTEPPRPSIVGTSIDSNPFFDRALADPRPSFSGIVTMPGSKSTGVLVAAPVKDSDGAVLGLVVGGLNPDRPTVAGLISLIRLGDTGYAQLVDDSGLLIASSRPEDLPEEIDHGPRFVRLIKSGERTVATCHACHETSHGPVRRPDILAFAPLSIAPWGVAIRQSEDEAFALLNDLQQKMVSLGVLSFLVLICLAYITTRSVVTPIKALTLASQRVAAGDFAGGIPPVGSDEIRSLAQSLEAMRRRLNLSREEMKEQNVELHRRTQELQRKTIELSALFEASKVLTSTLDVEMLFTSIVQKAKEILAPADAGAVFRWDRVSGRLVPRSSFGFDHEELCNVRLMPGEAIAGKVFQSGQALLLTGHEVPQGREDMSLENSHFFNRARPSGGDAQQVICVPLIASDVTTGALIVYNFYSPGSFSLADVQLLQALADQAAIAVENARLYEEVQQKEEQRRQLLDKVILAQEEERKRVARELHDEIGQALTALVMSLGSTEDALPKELTELRNRLAGIRDLTAGTLQEIRRLMLDLRPTLLDDLGLIPALSWYAETYLARAHIELLFETHGFKQRLAAQMETVLFRVVQEAITNIVKHSGASSAHISLSLKDSTVSAVIEDDGKGCDLVLVRQGVDKGPGLGLLGMEERVTLLGGRFRIESGSSWGTRVMLEIPLAPRKEIG